MEKSIGIRIAGAVLGAVAGGLIAYLGLDWFKPSGSPLFLIAFLGAAGAVLGWTAAMSVEQLRQ